jgi:DNA repair protein RecN (Recombination protein N)
LNAREDGNSVLESLSKVINEFQSIENHMEAIKEKKNMIEEAYYTLEEVSRDIRDLGEGIYYDDAKLSKINERIYEINSYKKKYGITVVDVLEYLSKLKNKYKDLVNSEEILKELKDRENSVLAKMRSIGEILHDIRSSNSELLQKKILKELSYVGLEKSNMQIEVKLEKEHNERGFDSVNFLISTNPGEPLKPLEKVLSGGELSRIMLAFKCVFADKEDISTLIFDEIDTGISGTVGQRVGEKMYQVSLGHQVLCITHLPQIAILSDHHYFVSKEVNNSKTYTKIKLLNKEEKIMQVASMMGGNKITEATIKNVREMLGFSEIKKIEINKVKNT